MHKFDAICISESSLNSETFSSANNLNIPGYNISCAGHPSGIDMGQFAFIIKSLCLLKILNINYLQE